MIPSAENPSEAPDADLDALTATALEFVQTTELKVEGRALEARPSRATLREVILPILLDCKRHPPEDRRGLVGIVGPPGSGKSVVTAWFAATADALRFAEFAFTALDGYHLPNAVLDRRTGTDPDGNIVPLRKLKGTPPTYNAGQLLADLRALRDSRDAFFMPAYSRVHHDPVPHGIRIGPEVRWVFVEGNFLFLDQSPWKEVRQLFDRKVYLDASDKILRERLATRHRAAGRDREWIEAHFRRTDGPDIRRVRTSARFADIAFQSDAAGRLRPMTADD